MFPFKEFSSPPTNPIPSTDRLHTFNRRRSACYRASKFDERQEAERLRLNRGRIAIETACSGGIKGDLVRRPGIPHREVVHARAVRERPRSGALGGASLVVVQLKLTADVRSHRTSLCGVGTDVCKPTFMGQEEPSRPPLEEQVSPDTKMWPAVLGILTRLSRRHFMARHRPFSPHPFVFFPPSNFDDWKEADRRRLDRRSNPVEARST